MRNLRISVGRSRTLCRKKFLSPISSKARNQRLVRRLKGLLHRVFHAKTSFPCRKYSDHCRKTSFATDPNAARSSNARSEEHTSELQSRGHLVCRLLLEKKKNMYRQMT